MGFLVHVMPGLGPFWKVQLEEGVMCLLDKWRRGLPQQLQTSVGLHRKKDFKNPLVRGHRRLQ